MDAIFQWLESMGVSPLLGGLIAGAVLVWLLFRLGSRDKSTNVLGTGLGSTTGNRATKSPLRGARDVRAGAGTDAGGKSAELSEQELKAICKHLEQGEKIEAIKLLRKHTGLGLAEAKAFVEDLEDNGGRK